MAQAHGLLEDVTRIAAIDHHCHADPVIASRTESWDPSRPLGAPPYPAVVRLRVDNPEWTRAWHALYGYVRDQIDTDDARAVLATKRRLLAEKGTDYPTWVLDRAGIEIAYVNAPVLGPGLDRPRFRWVPIADALLHPFDAKRTTLDRLMREAKVGALPATLREYLATVVTATLAHWRAAGAPAIKLLIAYRRTLDVEYVPEAQAHAVFARAAGGEELTAADSKALQDFLIRFVARECGRVGLVVHIHTGNGTGPYFNNGRANPALLEAMLDDTSLRQTNFVLIHGGWPFDKLAGAMLDKPTVHADFSGQTFYLSTRALSTVLRGWLEWQPEKVLFGTDSYSDPNTPLADWEEKAWLTTTTSREALALALEGMMQEGQITRPRALEIARLVLRDNAIRLYGLQLEP